MKKFLLGFVLTILLLLSLLYLALNTPYVVHRLAREFLPEYHLHYRSISGDPLHGITLERLFYKDRELAERLRLRINPFTLLKRKITVSRLEMEGVDTDVLERMLTDFIAPADASAAPSEASESSFSFPLAFEMKNIRLTLRPFERYGVRVDKEELSVDSIYYDGDRFNVGRLHQVARTSLGEVELRGTYHRRILDVDYLALDDLDLGGLRRLIDTLSAESGANGPPQSAQQAAKGQEENRSAATDLFLPRRILAGKIWASMRPYTVSRKIRLDWTQIEGRGLEIDLEHLRVDAGSVTLDLTSNLGSARLRLQAAPGRYRITEGVLSGVDLPGLIALGESNLGGSGESNLSLDRLPFVPPIVEAERLRIELRPGTLQGIDYRENALNLEKVTLDLHRRKILSGRLSAYLDTVPAHLSLTARVDANATRITSFEATGISVSEIRSWWRSKSQAPEEKREQGGGRAQRGETLPFVPPKLLIDKALFTTGPFDLDPLNVQKAAGTLDDVAVDLLSRRIERGRFSTMMEGDLADLRLRGRFGRGHLVLEEGSRLRIRQPLFTRYRLPLRAEAFSPVELAGEADRERLRVQATFHAREILAESNGTFNVDINRSVTLLDFGFGDGNLSLSERLSGRIPQAPFTLEAKLQRSNAGELGYRGMLTSPGVDLNDSRFADLLGRPRVDFEGNGHHLSARLDAGAFEGSFRTSDLHRGVFRLKSKHPLRLARYFKLPARLQKSQAALEATMPVDFETPLPLEANLTVESNLAHLQATVRYDGKIAAKIRSRFSRESLLREAFPDLRLSALNPLTLTLSEEPRRWRLQLKSRLLRGDLAYLTPSRQIGGNLQLAGTKIGVSGSPDTTIEAGMQTSSVRKLMEALNRLYRFQVPKIDGDLRVKLRLKRLEELELELNSKKFLPDSRSRIKSPINNLHLTLGADLKGKRLLLKRYGFETAGMKFYGTRASHIRVEHSKVIVPDLWINDSLKISGDYDLKKRKGKFIAKASDFKIVHENAKADLSVNIAATIDGERIDAKGKIIVLGGRLHYNLEAKRYATDEDIIILQHQRKNTESFFYKNVQLSIYIESKKPLIFKEKDLYAELRPQLSLLKSFNDNLQMLGSVHIAKNGHYIFRDKKFILSESSVNFTGNPTRPLLDINLVYHRYGRTIYITVNGVATEPNIQFSSNPFMTRDQILSFILFDTVDSGNSPDEMLSLVGGGLAKSILGNLGLKVDTLVVTSSGFEIGKKITDKITILYDQREKEPKVIVRIQHSFHTETDISIGSKSQSVDIIYRREF